MKLSIPLKAIQTRVMAVLIGFGLGAILILATGNNPLTAYASLLNGAFGNWYNITETLLRTIPLLLSGLGMVIALRCKVINLGGEGQIYMGALGATAMVLTFAGAPAIVLFPLGLAGAFLGGGLWAFIPGILKAKMKVSEVLTSIMLNYVALLFIDYLVTGTGPLHDPEALGWPTSPPIPPSVIIPTLSDVLPALFPRTRLHLGIIIAIVSVVIVYILMQKTTLGYRIKAVGANPQAAHLSGISVTQAVIISMLLSGGLSGIAGMVEVFGVQFRLVKGFSVNFGFTAIMVALFGKLDPLGTALSAFLFGALIVGADTMSRQTGVAIFIAYTLQGLIVAAAVAFENLKRQDLARLITRIKINVRR